MTGRHSLLLVAGCALLAVPLEAQQDRAVPRSGGGGGGHTSGSRPSPGVSSSSPSGGASSYSAPSSTSGGSSAPLTTAQRRHPRAGTGTGGRYGGGYYPSHPIYPGYPGWGWGWGGWGGYHPAYWGYWWPYSSWGWGWGGYGASWAGGATYTYVEADRGAMRLFVDPSETRVYVDGYFAGIADDFDGLFQRLKVAPGRHEISLKLAGHKTHRVRLYVGSGSTVEFDHEMEKGEGETFEDLTGGAPREARTSAPQGERSPSEPPPGMTGELHLRVSPIDASVYVNGEFQGTARETTSLSLAPGQHRVEVVRPGYQTAEREVEIAPEGVAELTIDLERP